MSIFSANLSTSVDAVGMRNREWLITNGLGGYASGTLAGVCTRRYHGAFVPNLSEPRGRHVLISRIDEEFAFGDRQIVVGGADFSDHSLSEDNLRWLRTFEVEGNIARWTYDFSGLVIRKSLVMPHQQNTLYLRYEVLEGERATIRLRPFLPFRRQDAAFTRNDAGFDVRSVNHGRWEAASADSPLFLRMSVFPGGEAFHSSATEAKDQLLWREQLRGYECHESTLSPGYFEMELQAGSAVTFVATTEPWESLAEDSVQPFLAEQTRIRGVIHTAGAGTDPFLSRLVIAADQFLILPESRPEEAVDARREGHRLRTVVAGYYWFLDWGRDTMISLEGLMLATRRFSEARATLMTFSHYVRDGLLPNLFPEGSRDGWYWTVDATLWYFHAIHRYVKASGDATLVTELLPTLRNIMEHHLHGTLFNIRVDPADCLLMASAPDHALTWMDAHMGDWIVTPRRGKPVEIQALWYNALCLMRDWETDASASARYKECAIRARKSFNLRFWNGAGSLFDVVDGENGNDDRLRPNQIFSISLDHPVLEPSRWLSVIEAVRGALLTPVGLRTLAASDPDYQKNYQGDLRSRDAAYHQGTVWPWLIGPFIEAWLKVHPDPQQARALLQAFPAHLDGAGLGSISEIFDGEPPHAPHGCIAQAWSVGEVLRAWQLTV